MVWPKTLKVHIWCAFGVAGNGKSEILMLCGNSEVGVAMATPATRRAPPMAEVYYTLQYQSIILLGYFSGTSHVLKYTGVFDHWSTCYT